MTNRRLGRKRDEERVRKGTERRGHWKREAGEEEKEGSCCSVASLSTSQG